MRKSKLESYESILEALVSKTLSLDNVAYETSMDCTVLNRRINFLMKNGLVEEREVDRKKMYAITERGVAVLKTLNFEKYLARIANKISVIDEALETIQSLEKDEKRK